MTPQPRRSEVAYHVAPVEDRTAITHDGLRPGNVGGDGQPPGVYLWQTAGEADLMRHEYGGYQADELEVWSVNIAGLALLPDPLIPGVLYSPAPVPRERTTLV